MKLLIHRTKGKWLCAASVGTASSAQSLTGGGWCSGADGWGRANRESPLDASLAPLTDMLRGLGAKIPSRVLKCLNRSMCHPGRLERI